MRQAEVNILQVVDSGTFNLYITLHVNLSEPMLKLIVENLLSLNDL